MSSESDNDISDEQGFVSDQNEVEGDESEEEEGEDLQI